LDLSDAINGNVPYPIQSYENKLAALAVEKISG
jgi:hypothetical protein